MSSIVYITPSGISEMANRVKSRLEERSCSDWQTFIDQDGHITLDEDAIVRGELEQIEPDLSPIAFETVVERTLEKLILKGVFEEMEQEIRERALSYVDWEQARRSPGAMLRYHGMTEGDFI